MNISATIEKLGTMRMYGFQRAYIQLTENAGQQQFTPDEIVAHLVDAEFDDKYNRKLDRLVKQARFKQQARFEQINYTHPRKLDKNYLLRLHNCDWIIKGRDLLVTGPTGVGKSYIICALGYQACINELKTLYITANKLLDSLAYAKADGTYFKVVDSLSKTRLLIIDDFALRKIDPKQCNMLMDVIDERHGRASTIVSSQLKVKDWYECFAEPTLADAILDRLVNGSYRIELEGETMRKFLEKE